MFMVNEPMVDYLKLSMWGGYAEAFVNHRVMNGWMEKAEAHKIPRYVGRKLGGVFYGSMVHQAKVYNLLQVEGAESDAWFAYFRADDDLRPTEEVRCKRIDLQVTVPMPKWYYAVRLHLDLEQSEIRTTKIYGGTEDGYTVTVGSRYSERYVRIYEKPSVIGDKREWYLRFEVELSDATADKVFRSDIDVANYLKGEVARITPLKGKSSMSYRTRKLFMDALEDYNIETVKMVRPDTNTMVWLKGQVSGAILNRLYSHDPEERYEMIRLVYQWFAEVENSIISMPPENEREIRALR